MRTKYIVTADGVPCAEAGRGKLAKRCLLAPIEDGECVKIFHSRAAARRAISRTVKFAGEVNGSMLDQWPAVQRLCKPYQWIVDSVHRHQKRTGQTTLVLPQRVPKGARITSAQMEASV